MTVSNTTNLRLTTAEARDTLPEEITKDNFETIDGYVAATALTNGSGAGVIAGTVVVAGAADNQFTTTTSGNNPKVLGVVQETIANGASGIVKHYGTTILRVGGTTAVGDWLVTSSSAGIASPVTSTNPPNGAFAIALTARTGAGTITVLLLAVGIAGIVQFPGSTGPTPTTDGVAEWDTNDDRLAVGSGSSTKYFFPDNQGSNITAAATLSIGSDKYYVVTGTTGVTGATANPAGQEVILKFSSAVALTHNATSFQLRGEASRTTVPGEIIRLLSLGSGNWQEISTGQTGPKSLAANQTVNNSTTLVDTALSFEVVSGGTYYFRATLFYTSGSTSNFKAGVYSTGTTSNALVSWWSWISSSWTFTQSIVLNSTVSGQGVGVNAQMMQIEGYFKTTSAGNVLVKFAQNTAIASDTVLLAGSILEVIRGS